MKIGCVLQARMGSTRLKGKMALPFHGDAGILECLLLRISRNIRSEIVVATTVDPDDSFIVDVAGKCGIKTYRGSIQDVQSRFLEVAALHGFDGVIRVCADNPFLDVMALRELEDCLGSQDCDYVSWFTSDGTPVIRKHYGFWAEGFTRKALLRARELSGSNLTREHVTPFFYENQELFDIVHLQVPQFVEERTDLRLTIDTIDDFNAAKTIYAEVANGGVFGINEVVATVDRHPDIKAVMRAEIYKNQK